MSYYIKSVLNELLAQQTQMGQASNLQQGTGTVIKQKQQRRPSDSGPDIQPIGNSLTVFWIVLGTDAAYDNKGGMGWHCLHSTHVATITFHSL